MKIQSTRNVADDLGIKCLVYGASGVGKTTLCATAPKPLILAAENGLLSIRKFAIDYVAITSINELLGILDELASNTDYETICLDSVSEIVDHCLFGIERKLKSRDARHVYPEVRSIVLHILKKLIALPQHIIVTCKQQHKEVADQQTVTCPAVAGTRLSNDLAYMFDMVFYLRVVNKQRYIIANAGENFVAKDRTNLLTAPVLVGNNFFVSLISKFKTGVTSNGQGKGRSVEGLSDAHPEDI